MGQARFAHVQHSVEDFPPDPIQHAPVLKDLQEPKGIAATDKDGRVVRQRVRPRPGLVNALDRESEGGKSTTNLAGVSVPVFGRVGDEGDPGTVAEELPDRIGAMLQIRPAGKPNC